MKRLIIFIMLAMTVGLVSAQDHYLNIGLGRGIPQKDFGETSDLFSSGYSLPGFVVEIEGAYFPISVIGISGMAGFGSLYSDWDSYYVNLAEYANGRSDLPGFVFPAKENMNATTGFWNYINILVGPEIAVPIYRFQIGLRAMGGTTVVVSPKRSIEFSDALTDVSINTQGAKFSLTYLYGGSLMYKLRSGTALKVSADYLTTKGAYDFDFMVETPVSNINESSRKKVDIEVFQVMIGLCYTF